VVNLNEKYLEWRDSGRFETIPPYITVFGVSESSYNSDPDEYDGVLAAIEQKKIAMNRLYKDNQMFDNTFFIPQIKIQWVEELDVRDLLLTGINDGKVNRFGSAIIVLHGSGEMISKSDENSYSNFVHCNKLVKDINWNVLAITLATCQAKFQKRVLSRSNHIFYIIGDHEGDIERNDGGMTEVLRQDTHKFCREWKEVLKSDVVSKKWFDFTKSKIQSNS
jgi:hypothetical protein